MATDRDEYEFIVRFRAEALAAAKQAEEALRGMAEGAGETKDELDDATKSMEQAAKAGAALATFLTSAYASFAFVKGALQEFSEFETAMVGIAKTSDLAAKDLSKLGDSFEQVAYQAGLPIEDFLKVAEIAGSLGIAGVDNIEAFTTAMVDLGGASNITAEDGANAIARMLNVTKEGIEGARTISSILVELGNISAATESEIVTRAQEIALATAAFGTSTTEALALGAAMAELGLRAETSGTAVGAIFIAMSTAAVKGGDDLKNFAAAAGLTVNEFKALQESDPTELFYKLLENLSDKDQNTIIKTLSDLNVLNADNAKTLIPLITGYERLKTVRKAAYEEQANPDALDNEAGKAAETLAREFTGLMQGLTNEIRQLGELLAPVAQAMIDVAKAVLDAFNALPEVFQNTILLAGLLGSTVLAATLALKGLALVFGLLIPLGIRTAAMGGAAAAGIAGVGVAGQVAAGGLAVMRYAIGALLGPVGLVIAVAGTLAYALSGTSEDVVDAAGTLAEASSALDAFTEASKRAAEEQIGLRRGITEATAAMVDQSRQALQDSAFKLGQYLDGFLAQGIEGGKFGDTLREELQGSIDSLEGITAHDIGADETFAAVAEILSNLQEGAIGVDTARDSLEKYTASGKEAIKLASNYRNALVTGDNAQIKAAASALINYADSIGMYGEELDNLRLLAAQPNLVPGTLEKGVADLAEAVERGGEAGQAIREILPPALLEILDAGAQAEIQLAATEAALQGNYDLSKLILEQEDPFLTLKNGAIAAMNAVLGLNGAMDPSLQDGYEEYYKSRATAEWMGASDAMSAAKEIISKFEGFRNTPYKDNDGNYRAGYGSDTYTTRDGKAHTVVQGQDVSTEDAARDLNRRIGNYFDTAIRQVGKTAFDALTADQQGVLASLLHNFGEGEFRQGGDLGALMQAIKERNTQGAADAIVALGGANGGINRKRRNEEAQAFGGASDYATRLSEEDQKTLDETTKLLEDRAKAQTELTDSQGEAIASAEFELSLIGRSTEAQARLRAEHELLTQAKRDGIDVDAISAETGKTYREGIEATARAIGKLAVQEEKAAKAQENAAKAKQFYNDQQEVFQQGVLDAILEGENLIDVLGGIAKAFARAALEGALFGTGPFGGSGGGLLSGVWDMFSGAVGGLFGGGNVVAAAKGHGFSYSGQGAADLVAYAKGGLPSLSDFSNGKVSAPTLFNMGPGKAGLMGEAGEEAILPLDGGRVLALLNGREVYLDLERGADGTLGVRLPDQDEAGNDWRDTYTPSKAYALGGVPMGAGDMLASAGVGRSRGGDRGRTSEPGSAGGAVSVQYSPTYNVQASGSGSSEKEQADRLTEQLDAHMKAAFAEFMTEQMRNGGMLNPGAKTY